jgi:hypothetical protein
MIAKESSVVGFGLFGAFIVVCLLSLGGCSVEEGVKPAPPVQAKSLELFFQRASLSTNEFEQYKVNGEKLFFECGAVRRGRFVADKQEFVSFPPNFSERYEQRLAQVVAALDGNNNEFDSPGRARGLADPGIFLLEVQLVNGVKSVKTSFDSVVDPNSKAEEELQQLAKLLRGAAGGEVCGNKSFFGLNSER